MADYDYVIGPGIAQSMQDAGDEPRSDEVFLVLAEGRKISLAYGRLGAYQWFQEDNAVRRTPFRD